MVRRRGAHDGGLRHRLAIAESVSGNLNAASTGSLRDAAGLSWREIAARLGVASSTAVYLYRAAESPRKDDGRRALIATGA